MFIYAFMHWWKLGFVRSGSNVEQLSGIMRSYILMELLQIWTRHEVLKLFIGGCFSNMVGVVVHDLERNSQITRTCCLVMKR